MVLQAHFRLPACRRAMTIGQASVTSAYEATYHTTSVLVVVSVGNITLLVDGDWWPFGIRCFFASVIPHNTASQYSGGNYDITMDTT
jgi:hypothetical protein